MKDQSPLGRQQWTALDLVRHVRWRVRVNRSLRGARIVREFVARSRRHEIRYSHSECNVEGYKLELVATKSILTWRRGYRDQEGGSSRARLFHCTTVELTLANIPNVDISGVQFLIVGTAFALSRC